MEGRLERCTMGMLTFCLFEGTEEKKKNKKRPTNRYLPPLLLHGDFPYLRLLGVTAKVDGGGLLGD